MWLKKRDFFTNPGDNKIKNPKDYLFCRIKHFLQLKGFNLELVLIEQVVKGNTISQKIAKILTGLAALVAKLSH